MILYEPFPFSMQHIRHHQTSSDIISIQKSVSVPSLPKSRRVGTSLKCPVLFNSCLRGSTASPWRTPVAWRVSGNERCHCYGPPGRRWSTAAVLPSALAKMPSWQAALDGLSRFWWFHSAQSTSWQGFLHISSILFPNLGTFYHPRNRFVHQLQSRNRQPEPATNRITPPESTGSGPQDADGLWQHAVALYAQRKQQDTISAKDRSSELFLECQYEWYYMRW